jgi:hypothetical protein
LTDWPVIGFAAARALGREGARITIASTTGRIHERVAEFAAAGIEASGHVGDLMAIGAAARIVEEVLEPTTADSTSSSTTPAWWPSERRRTPGSSPGWTRRSETAASPATCGRRSL